VAEYRAIILFAAANDSVASEKATAAAKAAVGKLDRLTTKRETWGAVAEEGE
jgi:hypothetical protein